VFDERFKVGVLVRTNPDLRIKGWSDLETASPSVEIKGGTIGIITFISMDLELVQVLWDEKAGWFRKSLFIKDLIWPV